MLLIEPKLYWETIAFIEGKNVLHPVFASLKTWLEDQMGLAAYNFVFEPLPGPGSGNRHRLYILLGSTEAYNSIMEPHQFGYSSIIQAKIAEAFTALALEYRFARPEQLDGLWVCYNDFAKEIQSTINNDCIGAVQALLRERYPHSGFWEVYTMGHGGVVFFHTDEEVRRNVETGVSEAMKRDWFNLLKQHDPLEQYHWESFDIIFDSKENLDTHYQGNLYYYFK